MISLTSYNNDYCESVIIDICFIPSVVYVSVVDTDFIVYEDEGALHFCLQVNHTVRTRAVVEISTSEGTASGTNHGASLQ